MRTKCSLRHHVGGDNCDICSPQRPRCDICSPQRHRKLSSAGRGPVSISVCAESIKHQKENVPNINWPTTLILRGGGTPCRQLCIRGQWGMVPAAPFPYATDRYIQSLGLFSASPVNSMSHPAPWHHGSLSPNVYRFPLLETLTSHASYDY